MKRWSILILGVVIVVAVSLVIAKRQSSSTKALEKESASAKTVEVKRSPVLVELFTSEGCSSCPPADEILSRLDREQPIAGALVIVLSQHVDYWNDLGWADPYSSASFSERQNEYASAFHHDGVYTPQMVVDGQAEFVGSNWEKANDAILSAEHTAKATVQISRAESGAADGAIQLNVKVENIPNLSANDTAEVLLAIAESDLHSSVARGENAGRSLSHTAVVRQLSVIGNLNSQSGKTFNASPAVNIASNWKRQNLRAVVFIQERESRRVLGASSFELK
ncbi:MAG: hypothetical protein DMF68_13825 [Acidobacteria bacterium]|nr:MAG: hypothetical protein DMF68_13825 [Acidobacteriota bacterium]